MIKISVLEQVDYLRNGIPDAVEIFTYDREPSSVAVEIVEEAGYVQYTFSHDDVSNIGHILFIRSEYMEQMKSE